MSKNISDNTGISLGLTFIVLGIVVQFAFLNYEIALWIATILISIGIAGLGIEIGKNPYGTGFQDIGVGVLFFLPSFLSLFYFSNTMLRIVLLFPLMVGIFGIIKGLIDQFNIRSGEKQKKETVKIDSRGTLEIVFSLVGFISNILTIVAFFMS